MLLYTPYPVIVSMKTTAAEQRPSGTLAAHLSKYVKHSRNPSGEISSLHLISVCLHNSPLAFTIRARGPHKRLHIESQEQLPVNIDH